MAKGDDEIRIEMPSGQAIRKGLAIVFTLILVGGAILGSFYVAGSTQRVVEFNKITGSVSTKGPGLHFKVPFIVGTTRYDVRSTLYNIEDESAASKDLQEATTSVAVRYRPDYSFMAEVHQQFGPDYANIVLGPAIQQILKSVTSNHTAPELVTERPVVMREFLSELAAREANYHIIVESADLTNFHFSVEYEAALEANQTAVVLAQQARQNLTRTEYEAEQNVVRANGTAQAQIINATATATSARLINEALQASPLYLKLETIRKWDGVMPRYFPSGAGGTFNFLVSDNEGGV